MKFVGVIIANPKNGFLLQQRDKKAPTFPLFWTLFGGVVKKSETPKKVLLRELK